MDYSTKDEGLVDVNELHRVIGRLERTNEDLREQLRMITHRERLMRHDQAAEYIGISKSKLSQLVRGGLVKRHTIAGIPIYKESEIIKSLKES